MQKQITLAIVIVAAISSVIVGTSVFPATAFVSAGVNPTLVQQGQFLGHVSYVVKGQDGLTKQYYQGDNLVMQMGKNCAVQMLFANKTALPGTCTGAVNGPKTGFNYVAIGNKTGFTTPAATDTTLEAGTDLTNGEIERRAGTVILTADSGSGAKAAITSANFAFASTGGTSGIASNKTGNNAITGAGLFDTATRSTGDMFAEQAVSVTVGNSDTLQVTWTITLN